MVALVAQRYAGPSNPLGIRALGRVSWQAPLLAGALTAAMIWVWGPVSAWVLAKLRLGSIATGTSALAGIPVWYLVVTIILVAASEEWLYRGYGIERLAALTGHLWMACAISISAFGLAHLPLWGLGPSLTMLVPGACFTLLYIWRRDIVFLMLAHVATDLYGLLIAPRLISRL